MKPTSDDDNLIIISPHKTWYINITGEIWVNYEVHLCQFCDYRSDVRLCLYKYTKVKTSVTSNEVRYFNKICFQDVLMAIIKRYDFTSYDYYCSVCSDRINVMISIVN